MKADVVIVGAGLAGLVAAIEARAHDASVLLLDKLPPPDAWNAVSLLPGGIGNDTFRSNGGGLARFAADVLVEHLGVVHIRTTDKFFGQGPSRFLAHIYPMGVYFNERYERFVDEGVADSDTIANAIAYQPGSKAGLIFDDKARARYPKEYERYPRREQLIKVAGSVEELAARLHLEAEPLKKMISEFNASIHDGKVSGPNVPKTASAYPIDTPPFYGFHPVRPAMNHTLGGLDVNSSDCGVLDEQGKPIPGLYAAGTVVNWAFGKPYKVGSVTTYRGSYHAGASSGAGIALVLGRLAGREAALARTEAAMA